MTFGLQAGGQKELKEVWREERCKDKKRERGRGREGGKGMKE